MACVISGEGRKEHEMKTEKNKNKRGVKRIKGEIHPCMIKGRWSVEFEFGQDDSDDGATLPKLATNSSTADQYPACTHVSSTQAQ